MQGLLKPYRIVSTVFRSSVVIFVLAIGMLFPAFSSQAKAASQTIVEHAALGPQIPIGQSGTLTATCGPGEQLLSGGFYSNAFEGAVFVEDNYPSSPNSWTVTAANGGASFIQMTTYVYCLQANYSIGTTVIQTTPGLSAATATLNCPQGSTLLSGGYASGGGTSHPTNNGWTAYGKSVYAVCATHNLSAAPSVSKLFNVPLGTGNIGYGLVSCSSGQLATGGGFDQTMTTSSQGLIDSNGTLTNWEVGAASRFDATTATVWVVCVTPTSTTIPVHVNYQLNAQWSKGFSANVTITNNTSTTINGWTLQFTFPGDQKITQIWNGNLTQSGEQVTITNMSYNKAIAPGQTITLGFNGTWTSNNTKPATFLFNGLLTT